MTNITQQIDAEIPDATKHIIISQELNAWKNDLYRMELRIRVNRKIGTDEKTIAALTEEMIRIEAAIDAFKEEAKALAKANGAEPKV